MHHCIPQRTNCKRIEHWSYLRQLLLINSANHVPVN
jgi:hypothetical protein